MELIKEQKNKKYYKNNAKTEVIVFVDEEIIDHLRRDFNYCLFRYLEKKGIKTNLLKTDSGYKKTGIICHKYQPIKLEIAVQNSAITEYAIKFMPEGTELDAPIVDWYVENNNQKIRVNPELTIELNKYSDNNELTNKLISNKTEIQQINKLALKMNKLLQKFFLAQGWILDQFCFSVGIINNNLAVVGEISPLFMVLRDHRGHLFDKDIFKKEKTKETLISQYRQLIEAIKEKI